MGALQDDIEFLDGGNYFSLATRKHSGDFVATPVWFAPADGSYYVFSAGQAGKVKRLRNYSQCRIAPCTVRGTLTGDWLEAEGEVLTGSDAEVQALEALHAKYGWQMKLTDMLSRLSGKYTRRTYIRVTLNAQ